MVRPYLVIFPDGGTMIADFVFEHKDGGVCFVSLFWDVPGRHPFHIMDGPVVIKDDTWTCGRGVTIRSLTPRDPEWSGWLEWMEYKNHEDGRYATDDVAINACIRDGALVPDELAKQAALSREQKKSVYIVKSPYAEESDQDNGIRTCLSCGKEFD